MRTYFIIASIFAVTCVYAVAVMIHMALFRDKSVYFLYARSWSRVLLKLSGININVLGADILQPAQRYVYVANHSSLFDIPVILAGIPDNIRIMYKRELERIPVFGWCLRMSPFIAIDRSDGRDAMAQLEKTVESMRSGSSVVVFPEGTRSLDGNVGAFKRGAFVLAARSEKPLIPITIIGTRNILPAGTRKIVGGEVTLVIAAPVVLPGQPDRTKEAEAMRTIRETIVDSLP